jgi:hypothetical protein
MFRLSEVEGPASSTLFRWVLFNADGDPIAQSVRPLGLASAKKSVEWLKANITDYDWNQPAIGLFQPLRDGGRFDAPEG